jgi:flagellar basal body P-ring formation protein FlgA
MLNHLHIFRFMMVSAIMLLATSAFAEENPWNARYGERDAVAQIAAVEQRPTLLPTGSEGYQFTYLDAEKIIRQALLTKGAADDLDVFINSKQGDALRQHTEPLTAEVEDITFDTKAKSWEATLYINAGDRPLAPAKLNGRYDELVELPVLKDRMRGGEIIAADDIVMRRVPAAQLRSNAVLSVEDLVGKSPRRSIADSRVIRQDELILPPVIRKGEMVTMAYMTPNMQIKTVGEALDEGAEGDVIRIRNSSSLNAVKAKITGPGTAEVQPLGLLASN